MDWSGIAGTWWRLRAPSRADEPAITAHGRGRDPLWIGIGPMAPRERAHQVVEEFLKGTAGVFGLVHLVVLKDSGAIVGMIGAQQREPETVEIVYGIAPAWRGHGLATEVLTAVTQSAHDQDPDSRYELVIADANAASIRVAEKSGYRFEEQRSSFVEATGQTYQDLVYLPSWYRTRHVG